MKYYILATYSRVPWYSVKMDYRIDQDKRNHFEPFGSEASVLAYFESMIQRELEYRDNINVPDYGRLVKAEAIEENKNGLKRSLRKWRF